MSKKKIEITHWTPEEELQIEDRLQEIKEASGRYILSTKSKPYRELEKLMANRSPQALNVKVRAMLTGKDPKEDKLLQEIYGKVDFETFMMIRERVSESA